MLDFVDALIAFLHWKISQDANFVEYMPLFAIAHFKLRCCESCWQSAEIQSSSTFTHSLRIFLFFWHVIWWCCLYLMACFEHLIQMENSIVHSKCLFFVTSSYAENVFMPLIQTTSRFLHKYIWPPSNHYEKLRLYTFTHSICAYKIADFHEN